MHSSAWKWIELTGSAGFIPLKIGFRGEREENEDINEKHCQTVLQTRWPDARLHVAGDTRGSRGYGDLDGIRCAAVSKGYTSPSHFWRYARYHRYRGASQDARCGRFYSRARTCQSGG